MITSKTTLPTTLIFTPFCATKHTNITGLANPLIPSIQPQPPSHGPSSSFLLYTDPMYPWTGEHGSISAREYRPSSSRSRGRGNPPYPIEARTPHSPRSRSASPLRAPPLGFSLGPTGPWVPAAPSDNPLPYPPSASALAPLRAQHPYAGYPPLSDPLVRSLPGEGSPVGPTFPPAGPHGGGGVWQEDEWRGVPEGRSRGLALPFRPDRRAPGEDFRGGPVDPYRRPGAPGGGHAPWPTMNQREVHDRWARYLPPDAS